MRRAALALVVAVVALSPVTAWAHGEHEAPVGHGTHGEHGTPAVPGPAGGVVVEGYRVELLSQPRPLAAGQRGQLIAKISDASTGAPVSGADVTIGLTHDGEADDPAPAPESTWAGHYAIAVTPAHAATFSVRVALAELDGRRFDPALVVDLPLSVGRAAGMGAAAWVLVALLAVVTLAGLHVIGARAARGVPRPGALDLLDLGWVRRLLTSRALQPTLQVPLVVLTAAVVLLGLHDVADGAVNVATKLVWTIWWAGIIFTFFLVGRAWCLACPVGALNEWTSRLAAPLRRLPRPFRNLWWATAAFIALTWADEQLGVVRSPRVTAWLILGFVGLAVAVGLAFERRSFCRYLCPIGGLIGLYSMTAPLELRAKNEAVCRSDPDKSCYRGHGPARGCPMLEFPQTMDRNNYCTFCAECVKGCARGNLALRVRAFGQDLWTTRRWLFEESYLAVALVGLTLVVTAQMLRGWPAFVSGLARWLPAPLRTGLRPVTYLGLVESVVLLATTLVVAPLLVAAAGALADRLAGEGPGARRTFAIFGYMFVPVGLALHLAHNVAHLLLEGGGIVPVVQRAVALYTPLRLGEPDWQVGPLASPSTVWLLQMTILVAFFVLSLLAGHRLSLRAYADPRAAARALGPMAVLSLLFTVAGIVLLNQPMGMRHGM